MTRPRYTSMFRPEPVENPVGACIMWGLTDRSALDLAGWMSRVRLPAPEPIDQLHATVMYSPSVGLPDDMYGCGGIPAQAKSASYDRRISRFGNDLEYLVLEIACPLIEMRHEFFKREWGLIPTFPTYRPHVTLSKRAHDWDEMFAAYASPIDFDLECIVPCSGEGP